MTVDFCIMSPLPFHHLTDADNLKKVEMKCHISDQNHGNRFCCPTSLIPDGIHK